MITEREISQYQEDGVVVVRNLLDEHSLRVLAEGIAQNLDHPTHRTVEHVNESNSGARFFYDACTVGENKAYDDLMLNTPMAEAVGRAMQSSRAIAFYISVFVRNSGTATRTPWHQDQVSWSAIGNQACSAWLSLDPVPKETALEFVRGSHRWSEQFRRPQFFANAYEHDVPDGLLEFPDIESHRDDYDIVSWAMNPGDCVIFHGMVAHGGSGNLPGGLGRRAVSVQWLGDDARFRIVPGGDDPQIAPELLKHGVQPGEPVICGVCPVAWSA